MAHGVAGLREAFNAVAQPAFNCTVAMLTYDRSHDYEWQVLTFNGIDAGGQPFETKSGLLRASTDLNQAAGAVAQQLLDQRKPAL